MQWYSLFSNASNYSLILRRSRYKQALALALFLSSGLILLISVSFFYLLALMIAVVGLLSIVVLLSVQRDDVIISQLILTCDGKVYLNQETKPYQLLATSRFSFIGCWLTMVPSTLLTNSVAINSNAVLSLKKNVDIVPKKLFIFKDSLSARDFSRVVKVIKQLK